MTKLINIILEKKTDDIRLHYFDQWAMMFKKNISLIEFPKNLTCDITSFILRCISRALNPNYIAYLTQFYILYLYFFRTIRLSENKK